MDHGGQPLLTCPGTCNLQLKLNGYTSEKVHLYMDELNQNMIQSGRLLFPLDIAIALRLREECDRNEVTRRKRSPSRVLEKSDTDL